ncbi:MAG: hypothetical protein ACJ0HV_04615 [Candidatus Pseudothioglobus sp.]
MEKAKQLPTKINFFNFAKKEVEAEWRLIKSPNYQDFLKSRSNENDKVEVDLSFRLENGRTPCVEGIIKTKACIRLSTLFG